MIRHASFLLLIGLLCAWPGVARSQESPARGHAPRNQAALDLGIAAGELSYARRIGPAVHLGAGLWGAWEPANSFDRQVWEPLGVALFTRYRPAPWLHADVGLAAARYVWADDCSDCSGSVVGPRAGIFVGYRGVFVGPEVMLGRASDEAHGPGLGLLWGVKARLVVGWGES